MISRRSFRVFLASTVAAALAVPFFPLGASSQGETLPQLSLQQILAIANVDAPPAGVGLKIHADFPEESPLLIDGLPVYSLTADISPTGVGRVERAATAQSATADASLDGCSDPTYAPSTALWKAEDIPIKWRFREGSIPSKLSPFHTRRAMRKAHQVWPRSHTDCTNSQSNTFRFNYVGKTAKRIGYDGVNTIDFGKLGASSLAVNYTWYKQGRILEVDMRLNKTEYSWTTNPNGKKAYNVKNVVTHELGHQIGLEDLTDPNGALTMFARITKGETHKITLGRGDLRGADHVAP